MDEGILNRRCTAWNQMKLNRFVINIAIYNNKKYKVTLICRLWLQVVVCDYNTSLFKRLLKSHLVCTIFKSSLVRVLEVIPFAGKIALVMRSLKKPFLEMGSFKVYDAKLWRSVQNLNCNATRDVPPEIRVQDIENKPYFTEILKCVCKEKSSDEWGMSRKYCITTLSHNT